MRRILLAVLLAASPLLPAAAADETPLGYWRTPDGDGVFQIAPCGDTLCGWLQGMRYSGSMPLDVWHRPQCHESLLTGFRPDPDQPKRWTGRILDPDSGRTYHASIWNPEPGVLALRGYLLMPMLGQTQRWTRYNGHIGPDCRLPPGA